MRVGSCVVFCLALVMGCEYQTTVGNSAPNAPPGPSSSTTSLDGPAQVPLETEAHRVEGADHEANYDNDSENYEREVAEVGVGKKGRNYGGGIITEPIRQHFRIRQQIVFLKITQDLRVFEAANERLPKSHEEFMEKIIKASNIPLPELPDGERLVWDPERGELMVERPRGSVAP